MIQMVDGASAHTNAFFLADKRSEMTLVAFKEYHAMVEHQMEKKLCCIRTNDGSEFCNTLWAAYFAEHGIIHETTAAYSSESNGVIECSNQTVIERTQVLLNDSSLPQSMWCEVAATVVYLKDFISTTCRSDTTPYEDWRGLRPDVSHLRPFSCTAYMKIPVEIGGEKLDVRSVKCVFIGYLAGTPTVSSIGLLGGLTAPMMSSLRKAWITALYHQLPVPRMRGRMSQTRSFSNCSPTMCLLMLDSL